MAQPYVISDEEYESEVDVYQLSEDLNEDTESERAWGSKRDTFYDGDAVEDENLEEICYTQRNLVSALCLDDYVCPWVKPDQHKNFQESDADLKDLILERILLSFQNSNSWLLRHAFHYIQQCQTRSPLTVEGNSYIQSKVHLLFCYGFTALFYMLQKMDKESNVKHPVTQQMSLLQDLFKDNHIDDELASALPLSPPINSSSTDSDELTHSQKVQKSSFVSETYPMEEKRAISYQMASNKGLLPRRKKEQRNPRVKHRNKYRKAMIKRKSQVLPVIHELYKYGGESSGIRSKLARSIQIK